MSNALFDGAFCTKLKAALVKASADFNENAVQLGQSVLNELFCESVRKRGGERTETGKTIEVMQADRLLFLYTSLQT